MKVGAPFIFKERMFFMELEGFEDVIIPKMINVSELAEHLDVGKDTAYNLVKRKDFPSIKLGREYKTFLDKLPEWLYKQQKNK